MSKISPNRIDLKGLSFGSLVVEDLIMSDGNAVYWRCRCTCGGVVEMTTKAIRVQKDPHCHACLGKRTMEAMRQFPKNTKLGRLRVHCLSDKKKLIFRCQCSGTHWASMRYCDLKKGRISCGIQCPSERRKGHGHHPNTKRYDFRGEQLTLLEIAGRLRMPPKRLYKRIQMGWPMERALYRPCVKGKGAPPKHLFLVEGRELTLLDLSKAFNIPRRSLQQYLVKERRTVPDALLQHARRARKTPQFKG